MKLTGTILRCLARKVNSGGKETYVTNLLVLDPDNSTGTNYAVEVWDEKPDELRLMPEIALTVTGVVNKTAGYLRLTERGLLIRTGRARYKLCHASSARSCSKTK